MKHAVTILLLAVMVLPLFGCAREQSVPEPEQTSAPTAVAATEVTDTTEASVAAVTTSPAETTPRSSYIPEKIEITTENWDDYFEVVYQPDARFDSFGELEKLYIYCYLEPKEEYAGRIDDRSAFSIELSYVAGNQGCQFAEDYSTFELVGEFVYTKDVTHTIDFSHGQADTIARHKVNIANNMIIAYCKDFKATRATGTLILKNK